MAKNTKSKIRIFNLIGDREVLRIIDSPKSWSVNQSVLRATFQKSGTTSLTTITTSLPFLVEEVNETKTQVKAKSKTQLWTGTILT